MGLQLQGLLPLADSFIPHTLCWASGRLLNMDTSSDDFFSSIWALSTLFSFPRFPYLLPNPWCLRLYPHTDPSHTLQSLRCSVRPRQGLMSASKSTPLLPRQRRSFPLETHRTDPAWCIPNTHLQTGWAKHPCDCCPLLHSSALQSNTRGRQ